MSSQRITSQYDPNYLPVLHFGEAFSYASPVSQLIPGRVELQPVTELDWLGLAPAMLSMVGPVRMALTINTLKYPDHPDPGYASFDQGNWPSEIALINWAPAMSAAFVVPYQFMGQNLLVGGAFDWMDIKDVAMSDKGGAPEGIYIQESADGKESYRNSQHRRSLRAYLTTSLAVTPWLNLALNAGRSSIKTSGGFNTMLFYWLGGSSAFLMNSRQVLHNREWGLSARLRHGDRGSTFATYSRINPDGDGHAETGDQYYGGIVDEQYSGKRITIRMGGQYQLRGISLITLIFERSNYLDEREVEYVPTGMIDPRPPTVPRVYVDEWQTTTASLSLIKNFRQGSSIWLAVKYSDDRGVNSEPGYTTAGTTRFVNVNTYRTEIPLGIVYRPRGGVGRWLDFRFGLKGEVVNRVQNRWYISEKSWPPSQEKLLRANIGLGLFPARKVQGYLYFYDLRRHILDRKSPPLARLGLGINL